MYVGVHARVRVCTTYIDIRVCVCAHMCIRASVTESKVTCVARSRVIRV